MKIQFIMRHGKTSLFLGYTSLVSAGLTFLVSAKVCKKNMLIAASTLECVPMPTLLSLQLNKDQDHPELFSNPIYFRSLAEKFKYLTLTNLPLILYMLEDE